MKRLNNLYSEIISIENLKIADNKARLGKSNTHAIIKHDENREENILNLHNQLLNKTFKTSEYKSFKIYKPKERIIYSLPYYPDRIVHHAIMNIMEPIWVSIFIAQTYACIKGRGVHKASYDLRKGLKDVNSTQYCLQIDIRKFYPTVDHDILITLIKKKIKDKDLIWLLEEIIRSEAGLPIGNYLSQYFSNLYLAYFDHFAKEQLGIKYYYRYADDIVVLSNCKHKLWGYFYNMQEYLNNKLNLEIKGNYTLYPVCTGIDFVGYVHFHTHTLLRKAIKKAMVKAVKKNRKKSIASYYGWATHCDSKHLLKSLNINYDK